MEFNSPPPCANTVTVRRNPHRKARATPTPSTTDPKPFSNPSSPESRSFPINDSLSTPVQPKPRLESAAASSVSPAVSNVKVYLRIRPLQRNCGHQHPKSRPKKAWPKNPAKKKTTKEAALKKKETENCIVVSEDSQSVTLTPPPALQESKRTKSEVYEGFSHVFSGDSTQDEIFGKMVRPLVDNFLGGRSGMLAALGPTGSGKTHTVFGSPREPGMITLALQRIFEQTKSSDTEASRTFFLSIFEIYSERGRGERMRDLCQDGSDLCLQQSNIKGLQEVVIPNAAQGELLVARAMLKRSTAMTNANSQSSRSHCIINIRYIFEGSDGETDLESNSAVLTIVDLAGAERERRTGNQGTRLLESNFINNTWMVFGLCLRSLLEHQKNPKKPLQKHYQNSLLTRFLQDYMEGRKRMTLVLTVKSEEEDYLDTSYLLRQASPYMKIKFTTSQEQPKMISTKRPSQTLIWNQQPKKVKCSSHDVCEIEGKGAEKENQLPVKDSEYSSQPKSCPHDARKSERDYQIMKNFARAFLKVLRQYNGKLKVAEDELQDLRESLANEKTRSLELEKQLTDLKSCSNCAKESSIDLTSSNVDNKLLSMTHTDGHAWFHADETNLGVQSQQSKNPTICDDSAEQHLDVFYQRNLDVRPPDCSCSAEKGISLNQLHLTCSQVQDGVPCLSLSGLETVIDNQELEANKNLDAQPKYNVSSRICNDSAEQRHEDLSQINLDVESEYSNNSRISGDSTEQYHEDLSQVRHPEVDVPTIPVSWVQNCSNRDFQAHAENPEDSISSSHLINKDTYRSSDVEGFAVSSLDQGDSSTCLVPQSSENSEGASDSPASTKKIAVTTSYEIIKVPDSPTSRGKIADTTSLEIVNVLDGKPLNTGKPKRRLQPASSVLLKDVSTFDMEDEIQKPKGNRGKKSAASDRHQTQGSIKLVHLLKSSLPL